MMRAATAANAVTGTLLGGDVLFRRVCSDSRRIEPGDLFIALRGERFDGHDYVALAFDRGAVAAIVAQGYVATSATGPVGTLIAVPDPRHALGLLAMTWRRRFRGPVAAITGSNGKTTVKEMVAAILRAHFGAKAVLATLGNLNNDIGLPLTVLGLRDDHRVAVLEIGMNHPGETGWLSGIARPTIALINNAQREHQEFMNSVADVAAEHAAILNALPEKGTAVVNADDDFASFWRQVVDRRNAEGAHLAVRDFGLLAPAVVTGKYRSGASATRVDAVTPAGAVNFELKLMGRHNVANALAAIAVATAAGASLDAVKQALESFRAVAGRLEIKQSSDGATILDDTYNANPDSVRAAIAVLARSTGQRWLVLGDMGEVGEHGIAFHREIGEYARAASLEWLLAIGPLAAHAVAAFGPGAEHFSDVDVLAAAVRGALRPDVTVLIKGSRFMRMERVVSALTGEAAEAL